jgi:oxygen-dependent protoporphyrinogen oxidase
VTERGRKQLIVRNGRFHPLPQSARSIATTRLVGSRAKLRMLCEPFVSHSGEMDETIASFTTRRFGREVFDYLIEPLLRTEIGGDVGQFSMRQLFPLVFAMEQQSKSLIGHWLASLFHGDNGRSTEQGFARLLEDTLPPSTRRQISFRHGMHTIPAALEASLAGAIELNCPARLSHREDSRWVIETGHDGNTRPQRVDAVILATPAHALAAMELPGRVRRYSASIEHVRYAPISMLTLGFRREDVDHPLDAGLILIPSAEQSGLTAIHVASTSFAERASSGYVTLTCVLDSSYASNDIPDADKQYYDTMRELQQLLGVRGIPVLRKHVHWPHGIPQYERGYDDVKRAADATELMNPGLYLAGNYRNGWSIGACIESGQQVARSVATYLARAG